MTFFFNVVFLIFTVLSFPKALKRRLSNPDYKGMFKRRLFCKKFKSNVSYPVIWLNGVSVGEIVSLGPLVKEIAKAYPGIELTISTTTGTGYKRAKALFPEHNVIAYPFDFSFIVNAFIKKINPAIFISAELDIWPNFISGCKKNNIPYVVVSGRISENSAKGYQKVRFLLRDSFESISQFLAQDKIDAQRASIVGVKEGNIQVCGNLKFDLIDLEKKELPQTLQKFEKSGENYFICSSTHDPEEKWLLNMLKKIDWQSNYPDWRCILVPRHPERANVVEKICSAHHFKTIKYSQLQDGVEYHDEIVIIDKIGVLPLLYQFCDLCYIGGSLIPHGSQNMIEPAAQGIPVLMGPYLHTFREASDFLLSKNGAIKVNSIDDLQKEMLLLLANSKDRLNIGTKAKDIIAENRGVALKTYSIIEKILKG
jgi:3-deoxy-D-manno-octulosonic-acid transferase